MHGYRIVDITVNDGTNIPLNKDSILVITGPNNSGKSRILKDIFFITDQNVVLSSCNLQFVGDHSEIIKEALGNPLIKANAQLILGNYHAYHGNFIQLIQSFGTNPQLRNPLLQTIMRYITTANRLTAIQTTPSEDPTIPFNIFALPSQIKSLYENAEFERNFYSKIETAFGQGVLLDKFTFQSNRLHYFVKSAAENRTDQGTPLFAEWFASQPTLDQQGDGVRSFCSVLLTVMADTKPLILIDEPEAFLHPPQVRRLAREIASSAPPDTQLVIATHSTEFLQGLIDFAQDRTSIIRVTRQNANDTEVNKVHRLEASDISKFWKDALLRTSDVLSSLFHDLAIIVEGDSDARFLRTLLDENQSMMQLGNIDIRFYHCGGKQRIYKIVNSLCAIGVPVTAIVDIDILNDKTVFFNLFHSLGNQDKEADDLFDYITRYINEQRSVRNAGDAKQEINELLRDVDDRKPIPAKTIVKINEAVEASSAWRLIKRSGQEFFTRGEPFNKFTQLLEICKRRGLFINPYGELENFDKTIEARKEEWLAEVYKKDFKTDIDLSKARDFLQDLIKYAYVATGIADRT